MTEKDLPGSLADTGDLALVRQRAEADTAHAVVTQVGVGTAAQLAAVVLTGGDQDIAVPVSAGISPS